MVQFSCNKYRLNLPTRMANPGAGVSVAAVKQPPELKPIVIGKPSPNV